MSPHRGRYAPSPTGGLHLGNARSALAAWLHTRWLQGIFVMRIEDLDRQRSRPGTAAINLDELRWLGLDWDEGPDCGGDYAPYTQSQRADYYHEILERLRPQTFECYLSRRDLQELASAPHGPLDIYGLPERALNQTLRTQKIAAGKPPALRLLGPQHEICFQDQLQGPQSWPVGDFVLVRADGEWAYQLAVVADDMAMCIDHIVRGDDLLPSTAAQIVLYRTLGAPIPDFLHVPLLHDHTGQRLSKRKGALTLSALRTSGVQAPALVGLLGYSLGLLAKPEALLPRELLSCYRPEYLRRDPGFLNMADLQWLGLEA
jgi:glutamyl-tRNA synthetase